MGGPSGMPRRRSKVIPKSSKQRCSRMKMLFDVRRMSSSRTRASRRKRRVRSTCSGSPCCQAGAQWWQQRRMME
eukprot:4071953-Amphidinium_carterae.1